MVRTRNDNAKPKAISSKSKKERERLKKSRHDDSDSESLGSDDSDTEDEEEDDSDYKPKKNINKKRRVIEDDEDDDTETEYTDIDEDEEEEDEEVQKKVRKLASKMFPSKYMKNRVKNDTKKKPKRVVVEEESDDEEDEEDDEDYDEEEEEEDDMDNKINIIFGFGPEAEGGSDDEEPTEDEDEECDSEDEQMFMKETYEKIVVPEQADKKKAKKSKKEKEKEKQLREDTQKELETSTFASEYADLVETKKYFSEKLKTRPNSKTLMKSIQDCKDSIQKLIKKTRGANAKDYHKLINAQKQKSESEMDYFRKKLSNKEQRKVMKDLEEINNHIQVDKPYRLALLESKIPTKYKATVMQKLNMLKSMDSNDSEYFKLKNWVDLFMRIPFGKYSVLNVNMAHGLDACQGFMESSMKTLDSCVYGLNDAKMQIMQLIGQWIANPSAMGTAIAIGGPPGTGKTTLVKEGISKILNREFIMFALGGATDASYYDGSPYVYEGSGPGAILRKIIECGEMNPCIMFDELDKISDSEKGREITGLLTHLTDTTQNTEFNDKFMSGVSIDMSRALFIASYNDEHAINSVLKDRMYTIRTKGYSTKEKVTIANDFLIPKIRQQVNFTQEEVIIPNETLEYIITTEGLTKCEDGVRNLKRCLEIIYTKLNLFRLVKTTDNFFNKEIDLKVSFPFTVTKKSVDALIKNDDKITSRSVLNSMYV
jgi:ATP-dependent Lon protease